ncbi:MAG: hypothetical protein AAF645_20045 [Myxococcota bacterium]
MLQLLPFTLSLLAATASAAAAQSPTAGTWFGNSNDAIAQLQLEEQAWIDELTERRASPRASRLRRLYRTAVPMMGVGLLGFVATGTAASLNFEAVDHLLLPMAITAGSVLLTGLAVFLAAQLGLRRQLYAEPRFAIRRLRREIRQLQPHAW